MPKRALAICLFVTAAAVVAGCSSSETGANAAAGGSAAGGAGQGAAGQGAAGQGAAGQGGAGQGGGPCEPLTQLCGGSPLRVDDAWLADNLDAAELEVIDVRALADYQASRVPGALHVDVNDVRATVGGVSGQVASQQVVQGVLAAAGLRPNITTVVVGDETEPTPARLVWTLHYFGHHDARLLDGGWGAWSQGGHVTDTSAPVIEPSAFTIDQLEEGLRVDANWIAARLDDPSVVLVDARSNGEFVSGHIPGALSIDWTTNVSGGELKPRAEVEALYAGIDPAATVVAYCQTGSRASVTYFVLRWLGFADVRLYDGSWAEWETIAELPKETG